MYTVKCILGVQPHGQSPCPTLATQNYMLQNERMYPSIDSGGPSFIHKKKGYPDRTNHVNTQHPALGGTPNIPPCVELRGYPTPDSGWQNTYDMYLRRRRCTQKRQRGPKSAKTFGECDIKTENVTT